MSGKIDDGAVANDQQQDNKALHPTAYSPSLVPRFGLPAAGELGRCIARAAFLKLELQK